MSTKTTPCKRCKEEILNGAAICPKCQKSQNFLFWFFERSLSISVLISSIGVLISVGLLILSLLQYEEARIDRISAEKALNQATKASIKAFELQKQILRSSALLYSATNVLNDEGTFTFDDPNTRRMLAARKELQSLFKTSLYEIFPDEEERNNWANENIPNYMLKDTIKDHN